MDETATPDPFDYSTETLLREKANECADLRELLVAVAGDLERLAAEYPELASRFLARAQRLRRRLWKAGAGPR
jgi:hypothetical protein